MSEGKIRARDVFEAYLLKYHEEQIKKILEEEEDQIHYSVEINFLTFSEEHVEVAEAIFASPVKMLFVFDSALVKALTQIYDKEKSNLHISLKTKVHVRLTGLPRYPELYRHAVPHASDVGRILCITGTVVRTVSPKMLEYQREYICLKCKHIFVIKADYTLYYQLNKPPRCPNPLACYSTNFSLSDSSPKFSHTKDYQEIKIQEQAQKLLVGTIPRSIWITLEDDLVDTVKPGDDVLVCGVVLQRWQSIVKGSRPSIDLVVKANNITVRNKQRIGNVVTKELKAEFREFWLRFQYDPLTARNIILSSFCPQVYGLYVVKLAVTILIAGGIQKMDANGTRTRGESHMLLVGDPGTGKSQFLKYVSSLVPRCVLTTGIGTTSAGLTVSAIREEGEWALEAGALVLADGGVCCIDEFNSIKESDRAAIHEAMEQQTISVAKAGIVCKLNTRCSILAATNPKGRYDIDESLNVNVALASPLLSRFDMILVLLDSRNSEWDRVVSSYILEGRDPLTFASKEMDKHLWPMEHLQAYFCYIKTLQPKMTESAHVILTKYYQLQRQTDGRNQARTTIRLLESLVRLSQGHARLMMKEEVSTIDAIVAVTLIEASMCGTSLIKGGNTLHTAFPSSPKEEYRKQIKVILQALGLLEILTREIERLNQEEKSHCSQSNQNELKTKPAQTLNNDQEKTRVLSVAQSKSFKRGLVQTQDKNYFSNILEMDEGFLENSETKEGESETNEKKIRKRLRISSESDDGDDESRNEVTFLEETPDSSLSDLTSEDVFERDDDSGRRVKRKSEVSPKGPRKFFSRSEQKTFKNNKVNTGEQNEDYCKPSANKIQSKNVHCREEICEDRVKSTEVSSCKNSILDLSIEKLSQDLLDFERPSSLVCKSVERNGISPKSSLILKKNTRWSDPLNLKSKLGKSRRKCSFKEKLGSNTEISDLEVNNSVASLEKNTKLSKVPNKLPSSDDKEVEENSSTENYSGSSLTDSNKNNFRRLNLQRFAYIKNSPKLFKRNEDATVPEDEPKENILQSNEVPSPIISRSSAKTSFLERLKKFSFKDSSNSLSNDDDSSREDVHDERDKESALLQNGSASSSEPVKKSNCIELAGQRVELRFRNPYEKDVSQSSTSHVGSQLSQKSMDKITNIFDHIDEDIDFDF